ncbi:MAG TPA: hypothetical protein VGI05_24595, partial [Streptosporangiaceae bacterium]
MNRTLSLVPRLLALAPGKLATRAAVVAVALVAVAGVTTAAGSTTHRVSSSFSFKLVPATGITACLPNASGHVTITTGSLNDSMVVTVTGMPAKAGFDLFVIQQPAKPFGVSWYQTDIQANSSGTGSATVRGVFDSETFSVSPGGTATFAPTHQYHLGLWFNDPNVPFNLGCEPGATS